MKHARTLFALLLFLSSLITGALGFRTLLAPEAMMSTFGVSAADVAALDLLIAVLGSVLLSLAIIVLLAAIWSWRGNEAGRTLGLVCAGTLILVGLGAWLLAGSTQILMLDGIRGATLIVLGFGWKSGKP